MKGVKTMGANSNASAIVEAYKNICSNVLEAIGDKSGCRTIIVSSPSSNEGKTTTAINLAVALSQLSKKVLIIDSDMRNGSVNKKLRLSSMYGLCDLLKNRCALDQAIVSAGASLDVILAGAQTLNAEELLLSDAFEDLISGLKFAYDYIIIDSAAVCEFVDIQYTAKYSDGVVLVVREGKSQYKKIDSAINLLKDKGINLIGSVLNASVR